MKKFAGNKRLADIKAQCMSLGLQFNDRLYRTEGHDHVVITGGGATVFYNTFNGRFFGRTDKGVEFNSDSSAWDHEPWMQALLSFFYIEKPEAVAV